MRNIDFGRNGRCGRIPLFQGLQNDFHTVKPFVLLLLFLPYFFHLHIVLKIAGIKGVLDALGKLLNVLVMLRVTAHGAAKIVDGIDIIHILSKHIITSLGLIPFSILLLYLKISFSPNFSAVAGKGWRKAFTDQIYVFLKKSPISPCIPIPCVL